MGKSGKKKQIASIAIDEFLSQFEKPKPEDEEIAKQAEDKRQNYVFLSFDLCNSTELKQRSAYWFSIISSFLGRYERITQMKCWKFNGDEILYYAEIRSIAELIGIIEEAYTFIGEIKNVLINNVKDMAARRNDDDISTELSMIDVRGTVWIAQTKDLSTEYHRGDPNYRFLLNENLDFSGINVDEGFRLRNLASKHKLVVDPKIVSLLFLEDRWFKYKDHSQKPRCKVSKDEKELKACLEKQANAFVVASKSFNNHDIITKIHTICQGFRVVGYQPCKGIWNGHRYPIVWYSDDWDDAIKDFVYDEKVDDQYALNVMREADPDSRANCLYSINYLPRILEQVDELKTVLTILNSLSLVTQKGQETTTTKTLGSRANLYYFVACVNRTTNNVLLFKRSRYRMHLKCVWDFGSVKHVSDEIPMNFVIADYYKSAFGLDIEVVGDDNRDGSPIRPFAFSPVHRFGKKHNGLLCLANIKDEKSDEEILTVVKQKIEEAKTKYPEAYQYEDVMFVNKEVLDQQGFIEMKDSEVFVDSTLAREDRNCAVGNGQNLCISNCRDSIWKAISYFAEEAKRKNVGEVGENI